MKGILLGSLAIAFIVMPTSSERGVLDRLATVTDDYLEECVNEGCSGEEVRELYSSYAEECLHEGCSFEEVRELAGSADRVDDLLAEFRKHGWTVDSSDFTPPPPRVCHQFTLADISTSEPTQRGTMNCKVVFFLTTKCKGLADDGHRFSWTEYGFGGVPRGRTKCH
jgi:hypothetical protein